MRTGNPVLNDATFRDVTLTGERRMTLTGTVNATVMFVTLLMAAAMFTWNKVSVDPGGAMIWVTGGAITGLILALVTVFKKEWAMWTGSLYAIAEGLFLGGLSAMYEAQFNGIVLQAVLLTAGVLFALLAAYSMRLIKATENFKLGVAAATGGIFLVYLATWILGFFGIQIPWIHESGMMGIGFSVFVVVIAALNLVLDFDFIEQGCEQGAPKHMEWFAAFGLLVTLVWLYIEILRLLSKLARRD
jgi:uncharacterized YccA/Bax inhibitor family protein